MELDPKKPIVLLGQTLEPDHDEKQPGWRGSAEMREPGDVWAFVHSDGAAHAVITLSDGNLVGVSRSGGTVADLEQALATVALRTLTTLSGMEAALLAAAGTAWPPERTGPERCLDCGRVYSGEECPCQALGEPVDLEDRLDAALAGEETDSPEIVRPRGAME